MHYKTCMVAVAANNHDATTISCLPLISSYQWLHENEKNFLSKQASTVHDSVHKVLFLLYCK